VVGEKYHLTIAHMGSLRLEEGETRKKVILSVSLHAHPFLFISSTLLSRSWLCWLFNFSQKTLLPLLSFSTHQKMTVNGGLTITITIIGYYVE
jgi:hypothetical protein